VPMYSAIVDSGIDNDGDPNTYQFQLEAPTAEDALAAIAAFGRDPDRVQDIDGPDHWVLMGLWAGIPLHSSGNWVHLACGETRGSYTVLMP
jgi:hypothetical protein